MNRLQNNRKLRKLRSILKKVNSLADSMRALPDAELQGYTGRLRQRLREGEEEASLLPEAFAAMREAMRRVLGIYLYDVQILGAAALYQGKLAEMKTGEGKTFTAVLPLYMNALTGRSTMLVTINEYLAERDGKMMAPLYQWMGISCAVGILRQNGNRPLKNPSAAKKKIYAADIVYTTNGALGFDYLLENLLVSKNDRYLRPFDYVILDEADAVLLDSAQTPLVISGMPKVQSNLYDTADFFVSMLTKKDYKVEEKDAWLTETGIRKAEKFFEIEDLFDGTHYEFVRHIMLALRAHHAFHRDRQYVVGGNEIKLLDVNTGRILEKTRLQAGQHQALEAKEGLPHTEVHRAMASITYQDFFNMFPRVAGMTGTAAVNAGEFMQIYGLDTVQIPTNRPVVRRDLKTCLYTSLEAEIEAAMEYILRVHQSGRPVLVVADTIAVTEVLSELLLEYEVPHNVLNAYNTAKEAAIIAEAGRKGAVTVATSVAGRGTDIKLDSAAAGLGGLAVVGVGCLKNRSLELQARGRSGRQGDPGTSIFFMSLEDKVVQENASDKLRRHAGDEGEILSGRVRKQVRLAQRNSEEKERDARRSTMEYGESIRLQRDLVYRSRRRIQEIERFDTDDLLGIERENIEAWLDELKELPGSHALLRYVLDHISYSPLRKPEKRDLASRESIERYLMEMAEAQLRQKMEMTARKDQPVEKDSQAQEDQPAEKDSQAQGDQSAKEELQVQKESKESRMQKRQTKFLRTMILKAVDEAWIEEVDYLQQLKNVMDGRRFTQKNMMYEYHLEAGEAYRTMQKTAKDRMMRNILLGEIRFGKKGEMEVILP